MKKHIAIIFVFFMVRNTYAQYMWQIKKDTVVKWYYYDGDEFDLSQVDDKKWTPAYSWTNLNYDYDYLMTPKRMEFENGICKFMCYRDTGLYTVPSWQFDSTFAKKYKSSLVNGNNFRYLFTAGNVWSKMQYTKGYFEIRFRTTDAFGMWPAFWLYGNNKDEIDFFELKGEKKDEIHIDVHCLKGCDHGYTGGSLFPKSFGGWIKTTELLNNGYNVLAGEWQDGYVKWYLNGVGIGYYKGDFGSPKMSLIIGTGPAKDGKGFSPGVNKSSTFPNSLDVDYVRVWYKEDKTKSEVLGHQHTIFTYFNSENATKAFLKKKISYMYKKKVFKNDLLTVSILPSSNGKYIITSHGSSINYSLSFWDKNGQEIAMKNISSSFDEVDLSKYNIKPYFRVKINYNSQKVEDVISSQ